MKLKIGISPCPNDTFIFDAIYHQKISLPDVSFEFILEDVETLNRLAGEEQLDIVKLSYARYFQVQENYALLRSGGAMGFGVGPLLVSKNPIALDEISNRRIAIPGEFTTAHFLFRSEFPNAQQKQFMLFSAIEDALEKQEADAGVLIHEGRFTYQQKGYYKLLDLGEAWDKKYQLPIPLGGIAINRRLAPYYSSINELIRNSIQMAWSQYPSLSDFIRCHAQEMDDAVMRQHIELYVNQFSEDVGAIGEGAIQRMKAILSPSTQFPIFLTTKS